MYSHSSLCPSIILSLLFPVTHINTSIHSYSQVQKIFPLHLYLYTMTLLSTINSNFSTVTQRHSLFFSHTLLFTKLHMDFSSSPTDICTYTIFWFLIRILWSKASFTLVSINSLCNNCYFRQFSPKQFTMNPQYKWVHFRDIDFVLLFCEVYQWVPNKLAIVYFCWAKYFQWWRGIYLQGL